MGDAGEGIRGATVLGELNACVDHWFAIRLADVEAQPERLGLQGEAIALVSDLARDRELQQADAVRPHLHNLIDLPASATADDLEKIADLFSPGGVHDGGLLARIILECCPLIAATSGALLLAAIIRLNWHGGKVGFQFLPDPASTDAEEYEEEAGSLISLLQWATDGNPRRVLTGDDLAFFESLLERFTIYRGTAGVTPAVAGAGVCWTTRREIAEWFAWRSAGFSHAAPLLISARLWKGEVCFVKAQEHEVVAQPSRSRVIKCRPQRACAETDWAAGLHLMGDG